MRGPLGKGYPDNTHKHQVNNELLGKDLWERDILMTQTSIKAIMFRASVKGHLGEGYPDNTDKHQVNNELL